MLQLLNICHHSVHYVHMCSINLYFISTYTICLCIHLSYTSLTWPMYRVECNGTRVIYDSETRLVNMSVFNINYSLYFCILIQCLVISY